MLIINYSRTSPLHAPPQQHWPGTRHGPSWRTHQDGRWLEFMWTPMTEIRKLETDPAASSGYLFRFILCTF